MTETLSARDRVFVQKARRTAEYALFFLLHVGDVHQEVEDIPPGSPKRPRVLDDACTYVTFALQQVASVIYSVHVSRDYLPANLEEPGAGRGQALPAAPRPIAFWRDQIWERANRTRPLREALRRVWASADPGGAQAQLDAPTVAPPLEGALACAASLAAVLREFLVLTRAPGLEARLVAFIADARRAVGRRFTLCLGTMLSLGLVVGVEAVRSLILNQGKTALLPLGLTAAPLLLFLRGPARRLKIDWGRRAFASRHTAEPDPTIERWPVGNPFTYRLHFEAARSLALLGTWFVPFGLALALLASHDRSWTSFLTVFLSLTLVAVFLRLCIFLDRWDFVDERPVRLRALSVGVIALGLILAEWFLVLSLFLLATGLPLIWRMWRRRAPRVLVASAATMTLLVTASALHASLSRTTNAWSDDTGVNPGDPELRHVTVKTWPLESDLDPVVVLAASGGGSRAAIYTAKTLVSLTNDVPEVAEHLQAISSVSGGSLAAAAYIARRYAGQRIDDSLETAVGNDFLLPTLIGAFTPWSSRGTAIEESWRKPGPDVPAMGDLRMSHLALAWQKAKDLRAALPPFPLPLFNTCALDGHDVVVTPLDRDLYTDASDGHWRRLRSAYGLQPTAVPTWVVDRDAIYGLEDLLPNANVLLASAVRASANFPFGFPLVDVETCSESLFLTPHDIPSAEAVRRTARTVDGVTTAACHGPATVHLTDGGVLSNSGMWSLFQLLSRPQSVEDLRKRGVLLILVEASKMPEYNESNRSLLTLFGTLGDRKPVAQGLHRRMFELLRQIYGGRLAIVQLDLIPEAAPESFNVYTTWALDPKSQDRLDRSFKRVWRTAKVGIADRFRTLKAGGKVTTDDLLRPPLD